MRRERWTSGQEVAKSVSIKSAERKSGGCARKAVGLTSGGLRRVRDDGLREPRGSSSVAQESAERVVGLCRRSTRAGHSPETGETVGLARPATDRVKARTVPREG